MDFKFDSSELNRNLDTFEGRFNAALEMYVDTASKNLESEAKRNRPWTDRTNRARLGLTGSYEVKPKLATIVLAHTVDYGVWLELAHEKNWAIIMPTINASSGGIINGLNNLFDKIKM